MDDRLFVGRLQPLRHLDADADRFFGRKRTDSDALRQGRPLYELQDKSPHPVRLFEAINRG